MRSREFKLSEDVYPVRKLVADAVKGLSLQPPQAIDLSSAETAAELECDREEVLRLLRNLLHNGIVHGGGSVSLSISQDGPSGDLVLEIADQGPGISPADLAHCLAPFGQADLSFARSNEGLGLGLPLSQAVIELHGGALTIEPRGVGTVVRVTFPARRVVHHVAPPQRMEATYARSA
jgi:signal transduction histidine kinase